MSTGKDIVNTIGLNDGLVLGIPVLGDIVGGGVGDIDGLRVVSGGNGDCVIGLRLGIFVGSFVIGLDEGDIVGVEVDGVFVGCVDGDDLLGEVVGGFICIIRSK